MTVNSEQEKNALKDSLYLAMTKQYGASLVANLSKDLFVIKNITDSLFDDFKQNDVYSSFYDYLKTKIHSDDFLKHETFLHKNLLGYFERGNTKAELIYRLKCTDGEFHWIQTTAIRLYGTEEDNGDIYAAYLIKIIDERKTIERNISDALLAAEAANKVKSEFLARISHDIRTPMNAVINLASIVRKNIDDKGKALEYLGKLDTSSAYLLSLINNILDMSKIESGKIILEPEYFNLHEFIGEIKNIISPQVNQKNQKFTITKNNISSSFLCSDTMRLKQILVNLLSNAVKFTSRGGTVTFDIEQKNAENNYVILVFTITDTGIGISQKLMKNIFKPFVQGERSIGTYEGSGLGLSIVHNLVKIMNGSVNVYSEQGIGTEFTVEIPVLKQEEINAKHEKENTKNQSQILDEIPHLKTVRKKTRENEGEKIDKDKIILLAEDDYINAEIACLILGEHGFKTDVARNGEEAVTKFKSSPVSFYSAVLMDLQMPLMDGYEAAAAIRSLPRADASLIPVIALSANTYKDDIDAAVKAGMNFHVAKPINTAELLQALKKVRILT